MLADYTINLAVDYVMYPAVVGAIGLAVGLAVKMLRRVEISKATLYPALLVGGLGAIGFSAADMPDGPPTSPVMTGPDKEKVTSQWIASGGDREQERHRLLPRGINGAVLATGIGLSLIGGVLWIGHLFSSSQPYAGATSTKDLAAEIGALRCLIKENRKQLEALTVVCAEFKNSAHLGVKMSKVDEDLCKLNDEVKSIIDAKTKETSPMVRLDGEFVTTSSQKYVDVSKKEELKTKPKRWYTGPLPAGWHDVFDEPPKEGQKVLVWWDGENCGSPRYCSMSVFEFKDGKFYHPVTGLSYVHQPVFWYDGETN